MRIFGKKRAYEGDIVDAIMGSRREEVMDRVKNGERINDACDRYAQATPIIIAASTSQWDLVEFFIENGASIWSHDEFGKSLGNIAERSRVVPDCAEGQALQRVKVILQERGFPSPAPHPDEVVRLVSEGKWPPAGAR